MGNRERLDDLERRLALLEDAAAPGAPPPPSAGGTWWLLDHLAARPHEREGVRGTIAYGGTAATPGAGPVSWQVEHPVADLLDVDLGAAAPVLAALGHPVRLEILRRLLLGARTVADLQQIPGTGTTGQIHHHLRALSAAGLVLAARNDFSLVPARVIPLLVVLAAAAGPDAVPTSTSKAPSTSGGSAPPGGRSDPA